MTVIRISRHAFDGLYEVDADVDGCFAVHETIPVTLGGWTLTHIPTGYAFLTGVLHGQAIACRAELLAGDLDWSQLTSPADVTPAHKRIGKALREKYGHQPEAGLDE